VDADALRGWLRLAEQKCEAAYFEWKATREQNSGEMNRAVEALVAEFRSHSGLKATEVRDRESLAHYLRWIVSACATQVQQFREYLENELLQATLAEIELIVATNVVRVLNSTMAPAKREQLRWVH
jgi:hypothetical protein